MQTKLFLAAASLLLLAACGSSPTGHEHGRGGAGGTSGHAGSGGTGGVDAGTGGVDAGTGGAADADAGGNSGAGGYDGGADSGRVADSGSMDASPDGGPDVIPFSPPDRPCDWVETPATNTNNPKCPNGIYVGDFLALDQINHPPLQELEGCTRVTGGLLIYDVRWTRDNLSHLKSLRAVDGVFSVNGYFDLAEAGGGSVSALENLRCVGHDLGLGLGIGAPQLVEVQGSVSVWADQPGLPALRRVWGDVSANPASRLPAVETVYGEFPGATAHSADNPRLAYIGCGSTFPICKDGILGCKREISGDAELQTLSACEVIVQRVEVSGVTGLQPLRSLRVVRGELGINRSEALTTLADLGALEYAGYLGLSTMPNLTDLHGLEGLKKVDRLVLSGMYAFSGIFGLGITNLRPLSNLRGSMSELYLGDLRNLTSVEGLENITEVGNLAFYDVPKLTSLGGLSALKATNYLRVEFTSLTDLRGLETLRQNTYSVNIQGNSKLQTVEGLSAFETAGSLTIMDNAILRDLHGFKNLRDVESLGITGNPSLPDCEVKWLLGRLGLSNSRPGATNGGTRNCTRE